MTKAEVPIREERKVVTAVFADIVGSTQLGERLDPEELKLVVGEAIARAIGAVEAFGGTIKDLAGDGVLALFGAPLAHEDDAERAVRAALRICDDIAEYAGEVERAWGISGFGIRVGVATGRVVVGAIGAGSRVEYAAMGDAVNTAARVQSHAEGGTVLVADSTRRSVETLFDWGETREIELKGKAEPVAVAVATGVRAGAVSMRGLEGVQARFVGRAAELDEAADLVRSVAEGSGGILIVSGEPGIGKSRLLAELRSFSDDVTSMRGASVWLEARCVSYGESIPYWPFRDLLRSWLGVEADEPELRVRVALRRHLERLFGDRVGEVYPYLGAMLGLTLEPDAQGRLTDLSPEASQFRTFEVIGELLRRLADDGPVIAVFEDLHWADATSLQLLERLVADTDTAALLLLLTMRPERDHAAWRLREQAMRELPHRTREVALEALPGEAGRELLHALVGADTLPAAMERRILDPADGNPFFLEEIVRSLADAGSLRRDGQDWRFDHEVAVEVPPTVEKVIVARIDRLGPDARDALLAAAVLGRSFGLPHLEAVVGSDGGAEASLLDLQRLDLVREGRRWPEREFRFKHALIQEAAYRTMVADRRRELHRRAAVWLEARHAGHEDEAAGLLARHWLAANDEDKAVAYLGRAGDRARQEYALDEAIGYYRELLPILERRGERREMALVLFKLALALHMSLRFREANETYQRAFPLWTAPPGRSGATATLEVASSFLPNDPDPRSAIAWPNIQLCMQLFDRLVEQWPERTIVPSLAERWEISDDGLRYVFHLREGLRWSDDMPLTARDVEFGIKRVLDPDAPGSSVAIYFVLENGQDFYLRRNTDRHAIGVRALDDRTVEFRLVAPAPYFLSVMNRPDGGPLPAHAIGEAGDDWVATGAQVVSGAFRIVERAPEHLVLERREAGNTTRDGNVARVRYVRSSIRDAIEPYDRDELDMVTVRYTPRLADVMPDGVADAHVGAPTWSGYIAFDHADPSAGDLRVRRALAHAIDREAVAAAMPINLVVASGGIVPPALQGHTPDIALRFDPALARELLGQVQGPPDLAVACLHDDLALLEPMIASWRDALDLDIEIRTWSLAEVATMPPPRQIAPIYFTGWLPGYADPEYFLRLLFQSDSRTNEGGFASPEFDDLIELARQERSDRGRLDLFHAADRMAVVDRVAAIPLVYGRSVAMVKPWVQGWWEFGKSSASFAELVVDPSSPRA